MAEGLRALALIPLLLLAACQRDATPAPTDGAEGADPSIAGELQSAHALRNGVYGITAADCDSDKRDNPETVVILADALLAEGTSHALRAIEEDGTLLFGAEGEALQRVQIEGGRLVRWPDVPRLRTVYERCDVAPNRT